MLRRLAHTLSCLAAAAALYVASFAAFVPAVVAYRWVEPPGSALASLRAEHGIGPSAPGRWTPLREVSHHLLNGLLHAEDDRFPAHNGFDVPRLRLAVRHNLHARRLGGGASTITQQLAKNLFLNPVRNPLRKLKEAGLTIVLEAALPKPRILELYVNMIEWGPGIYGIGAASRAYLGKPPRRLAQSEAALLAASVSNPLRRNPYRLTPGLRRRQERLLARMRRADLVPPAWIG